MFLFMNKSSDESNEKTNSDSWHLDQTVKRENQQTWQPRFPATHEVREQEREGSGSSDEQ